MITRDALLDAIVEKLCKDNISSSLEVSKIFMKDLESPISHANGVCLVYSGGKYYTEPQGEQQANTTQFNIQIGLRLSYLRSFGESIIDQIRQSVTSNLYVEGSAPYCISEVSDGQESGVWYWDLSFIIPGLNYVGE